METVCKIAEAVDEKKPCISKNMTVRGKLNGGNEAHVFFDVPVGVSVGEMIEKAGGIDGKYGEIIMGGAFTGKSTTLDAPTTKTDRSNPCNSRVPGSPRSNNGNSCMCLRRKRRAYA